MRTFFISIIFASLAATASAQSVLADWIADRTQIFNAADIDPAQFVWIARPVVVFAQSPNDPQFVRQVELLRADIDQLALRDVIIITDTDPANPSILRNILRPRAFMLAIIGKDGQTELRKPAPWDVREISRSIDKSLLRQQEVRERRELQ